MSDEDKAAKGTHQRSPNYPAEPLMVAINDAKKLFDAEKRTVVNSDTVAKALGYGGLNGRSRTKLASLRKYGLVENVGDGVQISPLAMRILHTPGGHPDYMVAIREAALRPESFRQFYETHREASEQSIQSELILKKGFSPEGAKTFANSFRETIIFAQLDKSDYSPSNDRDKSEDKEDKIVNAQASAAGISTATAKVSAIRAFVFPLPGGMAEIKVPHPMSKADFDLFSQTIKIWEPALVGQPQAQPPPVPFPANAMWKAKDSNIPVKIVRIMGEQKGEVYYQSEDGTGIPASQLKF
jgi:hypothetical protein